MKSHILLAFWGLSILLPSLSFAQATSSSSASKPIVITIGRVSLVKDRIKEQEARIKKCVRAGTLNRRRASTMLGVLKSLENQMKADIKKNRKNDLTDDQFRFLSKALGNNAKALPGSKAAKPKKTAAVHEHPALTPTVSPSATPVEASQPEDLESGK